MLNSVAASSILLRIEGMKHLAIIAFTLTAAVTQAHAQPEPLSVSDLHVTQEQAGISTVTGTATNTAGRPLTDAFVTFNLYDQSGTLVGNVMAHVQNLATSQRWQFRTQTPVAFARLQVSQVQVFPPAAPGR